MKLEKTIGHVRIVREAGSANVRLYIGPIWVLDYWRSGSLDRLPAEIAEVVRDFLTPLADNEGRAPDCTRVKFELDRNGNGIALAMGVVGELYVREFDGGYPECWLPLHARLCAWAEKERARWTVHIDLGAQVAFDGEFRGYGWYAEGRWHAAELSSETPPWVQRKAKEAYEAALKPKAEWTVSKWGEVKPGRVTVTCASQVSSGPISGNVSVFHACHESEVNDRWPEHIRTQVIAEILANRSARPTAELGEWRDEDGDLWQFRERGGKLERRLCLNGEWLQWRVGFLSRGSTVAEAAHAWQQECRKQTPCTVWSGCVGGAK